MIRYRINVLEELKEKGYNTYRLRNEKIFGEKTIQALRDQQSVSFATLDLLCELLDCKVEDIIYYCKQDSDSKP